MMHQKEVERIETNDDNNDYNLDESVTEHESDFRQQKLKEMNMEIGSENEGDTDYYPEDDELPDEQGNLTKGI